MSGGEGVAAAAHRDGEGHHGDPVCEWGDWEVAVTAANERRVEGIADWPGLGGDVVGLTWMVRYTVGLYTEDTSARSVME